MTLHPAPPFDLFNVYFEQIYDPTMHLVFTFDGALDEDVLRAATLRLIVANPYVGCRCVLVGAHRSGRRSGRDVGNRSVGRGPFRAS